MTALALAVLLAAVEPRVEGVLAVLAEPGCPRLFPMLTEHFQRAIPRGLRYLMARYPK